MARRWPPPTRVLSPWVTRSATPTSKLPPRLPPCASPEKLCRRNKDSRPPARCVLSASPNRSQQTKPQPSLIPRLLRLYSQRKLPRSLLRTRTLRRLRPTLRQPKTEPRLHPPGADPDVNLRERVQLPQVHLAAIRVEPMTAPLKPRAPVARVCRDTPRRRNIPPDGQD